jgi:poly(hydroxyalkanoate) depolymerase family esterase
VFAKELSVSLAENVDYLRRIRELTSVTGFGNYPRNARTGPGSALTEIDRFGSNPGDLKMYAYVPAQRPVLAPLVVVLHGCGQNAAGYDLGAGWSTLAKHYGFALLMPEQQRSNNVNGCFNWFNAQDIERDRGEAGSIRQMIARMVDDHDIDTRHIFVTGLSAGGAMTSVMLSLYPELFAAGAIIAGLPFGVARSMQSAMYEMHRAGSRPATELGDLVRQASQHAGPWPKVSVWHGSADRTVHPGNADAIVRQWLDLHGLPLEPMSEAVVDGYPRQVWWDGDGKTIVESFKITDMAHGTPLGVADNDERYGKQGAFMIEAGISSSYHIAKFFGLTSWIRERKADERKAVAESASARLIPPVSPIAAVGKPADIARVPRPARTPEDRAESRRQRRKASGVRAALARVLAAAGLTK